MRLPARFWGGNSIMANTDVGDMVVPHGDTSSVPLLMFGCLPHETLETELLKRIRGMSRVCLDVGAHLGWYTRLLSYPSRLSKVEHVIAFEPNPRTYEYLRVNTEHDTKIDAYPYAVGSLTQAVNFSCNHLHSDLSTVRPIGAKSISVQGITLDDFCTQHGLMCSVDFIKCDVEGNELAVLRGARELRSTQLPPIWLIEVIDSTFDQILLEK